MPGDPNAPDDSLSRRSEDIEHTEILNRLDVDEVGDDDDGGSDVFEEGDDGSDVKKKKKKKKKRKKKLGIVPESGDESTGPRMDPAVRKEAERRFDEAVASLTANSSDALWIRLDCAYISDAKVDILCQALRNNTHVLSLDLSQNDLGDASVWALCDAFLNGAAPDLIELLLRDNPDIGLEGKEALRALTTARKNLAVDTGVTARAQDSSDAVPQHELGTGTGGSLRDSAIVRKYFQVDEDDDDDGGGTEETRADAIGGGEDAHMDPEEVSALLWDQLLEALDADQPYIPALSEPLRAIAEQLEVEMSSCSLPMLEDTLLTDLKPFSQAASRQLTHLTPIMDVVPTPEVTQYSKTTPVARAGSHRIAVAEVVAQLLRAECPSVITAVAESGLLPRCATLALDLPNCSALQCAVLRSTRITLSASCSGCEVLRQQLLDSFHPTHQQPASKVDQRLVVGLPQRVAAIVEGAKGVVIGKREPNVGFAIAVAEALYVASTGNSAAPPPAPSNEMRGPSTEDQEGPTSPSITDKVVVNPKRLDPWQKELSQSLAALPEWVAITDSGSQEGEEDANRSTLSQMLSVQYAELGGPRPMRQTPLFEMDAELAALGGGGQMISGQELLALLRGLNVSGMAAGQQG